MTRGSPEAQATARTALAAGATLTALAIAQGTIGAFNPRPVVIVLIAATAGLATLAGERLRVRKDERHERDRRRRLLDEALLYWPPPLLREADPHRLGVFPSRRSESVSEASYVGRTVDDRLKSALAASPFVLVFGPPRAGKSRTALEAAKEVCGDARVLVPAGAEGLEQLLTLDPPPWPEFGSALLWLDGIDGYLGALDAEALERLEARSVTVLATIREDDYDAALAETGPRGEAAKAIAARFRGFEVATNLDEAERRRAKDRYAKDFDQGLGVGLSSTGKEEAKPPPAPRAGPGREGGEPEQPLLGDRFFLAPAGGCLAALVALALVIVTVGFEQPAPPSLAERADKAKREAAGADRFAVMSEVADFHGSGEGSYFFVLQAKDFQERAYGDSPAPSDEIRIYDIRGDELVERFNFQPDVDGAQFQFRRLGDLEGDGEAELVGGYGFPGEASLALVPFVVHWDSGSGEYRIDSLQDSPPVGAEAARRRSPAQEFLGHYRRRVTLHDREAGHDLAGYRVQDFAVTKDPERLVSAVVEKPRTPTDPGLVEVEGSILRLSGAEPSLIECRFRNGPRLVAPWTPGRLLFVELLDAWEPYVEKRVCVPDI